ncbi:PEP-CTERM sorting domain-containing protein [Oleiharenicola lentus]|uniref:PEP-CTERM sorting domain-containing protein n=1 Tax=Oleiharenicola lentus TaxID=2508720 RepID=UPI003F67CB97
MKFSKLQAFAPSAPRYLAGLALIAASFIASPRTSAQTNATWSATPGSAAWGWSVGGNWVGGVVPRESGDTAIFGLSNITNLTASSSIYVSSLTFNADAPAYTFNFGNDADVTIDGAGIVNFSGYAPEFVINRNPYHASPTGLTLAGAAKAGNAILRVNEWGAMRFQDTASLDQGTLTIAAYGSASFSGQTSFGTGAVTVEGQASVNLGNEATADSASVENHGSIYFNDDATAGNATILNYGSAIFHDDSSAGWATITSSGGMTFNTQSSAGQANITQTAGTIRFYDTSSAANSMLTVKGGVLTFFDNAVGGFSSIVAETGGAVEFRNNSDAQYALVTVRSGSAVRYFDSTSASASNVTVEAGGQFDMTGLDASELRVASISGAGEFIIGTTGTGDPRALYVGGYGADTEVSGVIVNGSGGRGGQLVKVGGGTLTLSGSQANTFYGGLTVERGTVVLAKSPGVISAGRGPIVIASQGTLRFAADNQLVADTWFTLAGGLLQTNGYSASIGSLELTANSTLDFGSFLVPSTISFEDSSEIDWTPGTTLTVLNYQVGFSNLRFGSNGSGLTVDQLGQIYFSGYGTGLARIDLDGYVSPVSAIPEPSTYAALAGAAVLGFAIVRRRRQATA